MAVNREVVSSTSKTGELNPHIVRSFFVRCTSPSLHQLLLRQILGVGLELLVRVELGWVMQLHLAKVVKERDPSTHSRRTLLKATYSRKRCFSPAGDIRSYSTGSQVWMHWCSSRAMGHWTTARSTELVDRLCQQCPHLVRRTDNAA